ncbi:MAG: Fpg/Nei family DNA glycosylase [Propionibacteriales bacterium]|nr:Fpg/Nei family DNA glycosylase [Propionibacteriales bacterium]
MPEGHTLRRLARDLETTFGGRRVRVASPQGRFAGSAGLLDSTLLRGASSAGKHLFLEFSRGRWVHIHLGLYGTFQIGTAPAPDPRGQIRLRLSTSRAYADLRGPTACELVTGRERDGVLARLGPDPLSPYAEPTHAWRRIARSRTPIGVLLTRQDVVSGVGNAYRAELLFRHRVEPHRSGRELTREVWCAMWADLVALMHEGVRTGRIDTVRSEHTPEAMGRPPRTDRHGGEVYVYRRAGQGCLVCSTPVATEVMAGRNLFWCPSCQTL